MSAEDEKVQKRRDDALRRALNTLPKHHKDMKKGRAKKKPQAQPTTSSEKQT